MIFIGIIAAAILYTFILTGIEYIILFPFNDGKYICISPRFMQEQINFGNYIIPIIIRIINPIWTLICFIHYIINKGRI